MKIALICLTKDFNRAGNSGSYRDYLYVVNELNEAGIEHTTINGENVQAETHKEFDGIIMFNASVNFFGGVANPTLLQKWAFIAQQKCPIIYWFTDFLLPLQNIVPVVKKRFDIQLPEIYSDRITLLSYASELEAIKEWWNKNPKNIPISHAVFYDLSEACYKGLKLLVPLAESDPSYAYVGNFRNGHRLKQIQKLVEETDVSIYGRWPEKYIPFGAKYNGPISELEVDGILNKHFAQYVTYDYEFLKFKPVIFRNIITINSGSLPYIDKKLDYVLEQIPSKYQTLLTTLPERSLTDSERAQIIYELQQILPSLFEAKFATLIKHICLSA